MSQQVICVVARQRSGTTALRNILTGSGRMYDFGEIFQTNSQGGKGSFFGFCRNKEILLSDAATGPEVAELCANYLDHLRKVAGDKHVLIDVKYNSWNAVRPVWHYIHEEPYFLAFLKKMGALFIFLQRLDVADQIVSSAIAETNDKWHNLSLDASAIRQIDVDINMARREARLMCQSEVFLWGLLKRYEKRLPFVYETLYVDGLLTKAAQLAISQALGEDLVYGAAPTIRKNEVDKALAIRNYEDVRKAVAEEIAGVRRPQFA